MWKFLLILGAIALVIAPSFLTARTQAKIQAGSPAFGSAQVAHGSLAGAFLRSTASYFVAQSSASTSSFHEWFATIIPSPISMLLLGGCLVLFGAFLRRRQKRSGDLVREKGTGS
jgi:hypothetical protein